MALRNPRPCGADTPTGPCRRLTLSPGQCGAEHRGVGADVMPDRLVIEEPGRDPLVLVDTGPDPDAVLRVDVTRPAVTQIEALSPDLRAAVETQIRELRSWDVGTFVRHAQRKGRTPMGQLHYIRADRARILIALDDDQATILGVGLRQPTPAPT